MQRDSNPAVCWANSRWTRLSKQSPGMQSATKASVQLAMQRKAHHQAGSGKRMYKKPYLTYSISLGSQPSISPLLLQGSIEHCVSPGAKSSHVITHKSI